MHARTQTHTHTHTHKQTHAHRVVCVSKYICVCEQPAVFDKFTAVVTELQDTTKALHQMATQVDPVFMAIDFSALSLTETLTDDEASLGSLSHHHRTRIPLHRLNPLPGTTSTTTRDLRQNTPKRPVAIGKLCCFYARKFLYNLVNNNSTRLSLLPPVPFALSQCTKQK